MKATFNDFLVEHPTCGGFANNADAQEVFDILSEDESIFAMIEAADQGRPALEPCIGKLEEWSDSQPSKGINFTDEFTRKAIGRMVKTIIAPFGYEVTTRKAISKQVGTRFFKTASCYEKTGNARLKVVKQIVEV